MADKIQIIKALDTSKPALENHAIARCAEAWEKAWRAGRADGKSEEIAAKQAGEAFRAALPPLASRDNCRDFVACVAQGILLGAIDDKNAGKLLYAAQVALSAASSEDKVQRYAGIAAYASLTETEMQHVKKFMPKRRSN